MSDKPITKDFGTWDSPINTDFITQQVIGIEDVVVDATTGNIYHAEKRPSENGRNALVDTTSGKDLVPPPWDAKTGVHTYGGSPTTAFNGRIIFSNAADSRLYILKGTEPSPVTPDNRAWRYADIVCFPENPDMLVAIREDHTHPEPINVVTTLVLVDTRDSSVQIVAKGADFYSNPCFSPDGRNVAWIQWNHPEMPWQSAELVVGEVDVSNGSLVFNNTKVVAGVHGKVVAQQPTWISHKELIFICDKSGYLNPWIYTAKDGASPLLRQPLAEDFGEPMWFLGGSSYAVLDADLSVWSTVKSGMAAVYLLRHSTGQLTEIHTDCVEIRRVRRIDNKSVVFIAKTGIQPDFILKLSLEANGSFAIKTLKKTLLPSQSVSVDYFSIGRPIALKDSKGQDIYALFYPPTNPNYQGPSCDVPPCVVFIHGGPSARQGAGFDWYHQYYTSRGWAWLDVNYGGSTGYGRKYMERIYGLWGEVDIHDSMQAVKECHQRGLISYNRVVVRGNSAGGFSVLRSLVALPNFYQAGISSYGISDLKRLVKTTHKFQLHYMFKLQGGTPAEIPDVYEARSPVYHADQIKAPLLMLQGDADVAVPPSQAEKIVETIRKNEGRVDYVLFPGEGHGWRKASTIKAALEKEMSFVVDVFGL
ncbi:alpha/beta-hydrolase [Ramaria rubella]|nr:alpha/beta-hydrolase [Ramaria rubella]